MAEEGRYLGAPLNNRLNWKFNTETIYKEKLSRPYFWKKLRLNKHIVNKFVVESAICFVAIC